MDSNLVLRRFHGRALNKKTHVFVQVFGSNFGKKQLEISNNVPFWRFCCWPTKEGSHKVNDVDDVVVVVKQGKQNGVTHTDTCFSYKRETTAFHHPPK
jgi:hypothetical protein